MSLFLFKIILTNTALNQKVFLVQTDTTVGFLSQDAQFLAEIKERPLNKPFVQVTSTYKTLKTMVRIPRQHKNRIRRVKQQTFVYSNNKAIRVVKDKDHARFIKPFKWFYSTSANEKALSYNKEFAQSKSDIIIENIKGLFEGESSSIYKLGKTKLRRLR